MMNIKVPVETFNKLLSNFKGKVIITDALLPTTRLLKGKTVKWPDFKHTQEKQLIICDTRNAALARYKMDMEKFGRQYYEQLDRLRKFMFFQLHMFGMDNVQTFCINKDIANDIIQFKGDDIDFSNINIHEYERSDWYRSVMGAGIDMSQRIMIGVNLPFTKEMNFKGYARVFLHVYEKVKKYMHVFNKYKFLKKKDMPRSEKEELLHKAIWKDEIKNIFFNTIGRVKDKNGIDNSVVLMFGNTEDEVRECLPKGSWNIVSCTSGDFVLESHIMSILWLNGGKPDDVAGLPYITKLVKFMLSNPSKEYKYGFISSNVKVDRQKLGVKNTKKIIQKYNHLIPDITIHDEYFEVSDKYFDKLIVSKSYFRKLKESIKSTIKRYKKDENP